MSPDLAGKPGNKRNRLSQPSNDIPWICADELQLPDTRLYWLPVSTFPLPHDERSWLIEFLLRFTTQLKGRHKLRGEFFIAYKMLAGELIDTYKRYAFRCTKMIGLGRSPNTDLPAFPSEEDLKEFAASGKPFDYRDWVGDYLIWLIHPEKREQLELFFGTGKTTYVLLPPDPKIKVPDLPFTPALRASMPVFQKMDVDGRITSSFLMQDSFLEKSKLMFGEGLEDSVEYMGISFIMPLLNSSHFFAASPHLRKEWFSFIDVYINESPDDKGILLAFQNKVYEEDFHQVLESMKADGYGYGEQR